MKNGLPVADILAPHIEGGAREHKRSEKLLIRRGMLGSNEYLVPGSGLRLNKYGNITRGAMTKILSQLKSFEEVGFNMNTRSAQSNYFLIRKKKGGMIPGIYQRTKKGIKPLLIIVKHTNYKARFDFISVVQRYVSRTYAKTFDNNFKYWKERLKGGR